MVSSKIAGIILYLILIVVFYGFSNNYGFHIKPNRIKVISTLVIAVIMLPCILIIR